MTVTKSIKMTVKENPRMVMIKNLKMIIIENLKMLGPAVNRQPGFSRGTRRAKQRSEEHCLLQTGRCCKVAADLPDQLAGNLARCCLPT